VFVPFSIDRWLAFPFVAALAACASGTSGPAPTVSSSAGTSGGRPASSAGGAAGGGTSGGSSGGASTGSGDAGFDAGCTPGDGGDCPFCGAANFVVRCGIKGIGATCPRHSSCGPGDGCPCDEGYVAVRCGDGGACTDSNPCQGSDWWCAPVEPGGCGALNFTVPCPDGGGGVTYCPTHASCGTAGCSGCQDGYVDESCGGEACEAQPCTYPEWWCAPRQAGPCGPQNFTVACTDGDGGVSGYCPTNGSCDGQTCGCPSGDVLANCADEPCGLGSCDEDEFWCAPAGGCGALNYTIQCPGNYYCPSHSQCVDGNCQCASGYEAYDCAGVLCSRVDGGCQAPDVWCLQDAG